MKRLLLLSLLVLLCFSTASAATVSEAVENVKEKAAAYEAGALNYLQLKVFVNTAREQIYDSLHKNAEEELSKEEFVKVMGWSEEEVRKALGEPTGIEKWVWVENQKRTIMLKEPMPRWQKIIFSGNKIKIALNAWPHVSIYGNQMHKFYWVDFELGFKRETTAIDIGGIISDLKASTGNLQEFARKAVQYEEALGHYLKESEDCSSALAALLGNPAGQEERIEWRGTLFESEKGFAALFGEENMDEQWHGFHLRIEAEFREMGQVHEIKQEMDRDALFKQPASALEQMLEQAVSEAKQALAAGRTSEAMNARFRIETLSNALSEKANREKDPRKEEAYTVEQLFSFAESLFNNHATGFVREKVKEAKYAATLLEEKEARQDSWCEHQEQWCDDGFVCLNNTCTSAKGGSEICDNKIDDDGDFVVDCEDPDCTEFKDCGRACESVCRESCWPCQEQNCRQECDACGKCNNANPDNWEACKKQCKACEECNETQCGAVCESCRECENRVYGDGCYNECKPCDACWKQKGEKEEDKKCGELCIPCNNCRHDAGSMKCYANQEYNREDGGCCCIEGFEDCDGDWENGCETAGNCGEYCPSEEELEMQIKQCKKAGQEARKEVNKFGCIYIECVGQTECGNGSCEAGEDSSNCPEDCRAGECGNHTCDDELGETCESCPQDCKCWPVCGDEESLQEEKNICISKGLAWKETIREDGCPMIECVIGGAECGDNKCDESEDCESCPQDCGECSACPNESELQKMKEECIAQGLEWELVEKQCFSCCASINCIYPQPTEPAPECGNNSCEEGESCESCPTDCGTCQTAKTMPIEKKSVFNPLTGFVMIGLETEEDKKDFEKKKLEKELGEGPEKASPEESCTNFACPPNQYCNNETGWCQCIKGWNNCDGDWMNGCETQGNCTPCQSDADCAPARCSEDRRRIDSFKCVEGGSWEEEKRFAAIEGKCGSKASGEETRGIWIEARGEGFENFHETKAKIYMEKEGKGDNQWCKKELEFAIMERAELEQSFNQQFVDWFFGEFVEQSPEEFQVQEETIWAIYESFQRNSEETARALSCLGSTDWPKEATPIRISFDSPNGRVEFWEEFKTTSVFEQPNQTILSPYMKMWIFPNKELFKKLFKEEMMRQQEKGEFGPAPNEKEKMRSSERVMGTINRIAGSYGGDAKLVIQIKDGQQVLVNMLLSIDPEELIDMSIAGQKPADTDVTISVGYDFFYDMMSAMIKDVEGVQTVKPHWEQQELGPEGPPKIDDVVMMVRFFTSIIGGVFTGQVSVDPITEIPRTVMLLGDIMNLAGSQIVG